jgi:hypothetical protein
MKHSRIAMLVVVAFFLVTGAYSTADGRLLEAGIAALNAVFAGLVFYRLRDAPRAV